MYLRCHGRPPIHPSYVKTTSCVGGTMKKKPLVRSFQSCIISSSSSSSCHVTSDEVLFSLSRCFLNHLNSVAVRRGAAADQLRSHVTDGTRLVKLSTEMTKRPRPQSADPRDDPSQTQVNVNRGGVSWSSVPYRPAQS